MGAIIFGDTVVFGVNVVTIDGASFLLNNITIVIIVLIVGGLPLVAFSALIIVFVVGNVFIVLVVIVDVLVSRDFEGKLTLFLISMQWSFL